MIDHLKGFWSGRRRGIIRSGRVLRILSRIFRLTGHGIFARFDFFCLIGV
ncbi:hypothetical protein AAFO92_20960 [Roseovarius sp. CAU 1744]